MKNYHGNVSREHKKKIIENHKGESCLHIHTFKLETDNFSLRLNEGLFTHHVYTLLILYSCGENNGH